MNPAGLFPSSLVIPPSPTGSDDTIKGGDTPPRQAEIQSNKYLYEQDDALAAPEIISYVSLPYLKSSTGKPLLFRMEHDSPGPSTLTNLEHRHIQQATTVTPFVELGEARVITQTTVAIRTEQEEIIGRKCVRKRRHHEPSSEREQGSALRSYRDVSPEIKLKRSRRIKPDATYHKTDLVLKRTVVDWKETVSRIKVPKVDELCQQAYKLVRRDQAQKQPLPLSSKLQEPRYKNAFNNFGYSVLHSAVNDSDLHAVIIMINAQSNLNAKNHLGYTPLIMAVRNKKYAIMQALLRGGANANIGDLKMNTALFFAVSNEDVLAMEELIKYGANVNSRNFQGQTPLTNAMKEKKWLSVNHLLKFKPALSLYNCYGDSAVSIAIKENHGELLHTLLQNGANLDTANYAGITPLIEAVKSKSTQMVEMICNHTTFFNVQDHKGFTPLHHAVAKELCDVAHILINHQVDVNLPAAWGDTPLNMAVKQRCYSMVEILLNAGGDPNIADLKGNTCLSEVVTFGSLRLTNLLLANGADVSIRNRDGVLPYDQARLILNKETAKGGSVTAFQKIYNAIVKAEESAAEIIGEEISFVPNPINEETDVTSTQTVLQIPATSSSPSDIVSELYRKHFPNVSFKRK